MRNGSLAVLIAMGFMVGTANAQIATDQDGQWFPGAVWVGDIPPTSVDVAELGHAISLDAGVASGSSVSISGLDFLAPGSLSIGNQIALDLTGASSWNVGSNLNLDNRTTLTLGGSVLLSDNTESRLHSGTGTGQLIVPVGVTLDGLTGGGLTAAVTAQLNYPGSMFQWQGGRIIDGTVENIGQMNLVGPDNKVISGRLRNSALMRHDGSGDLLLSNQALENEVGAVYDLVSNAGIVNNGSGLMINRGTLRKSGGSGDSPITVQVNGLDGHRLEVTDGSLQFSDIALFDSTSYDLMAPATVAFLSGSTLRLTSTNSTMPPTAHTGSGDGQIRMLPGSTIDALSGGGRTGVTAQLNFPGDMFQWEGGRLIDGTVENLGQINLTGAEQKDITGILLNSADMVQSGSGGLGLENTALTNGPNGVYDMRTDSGIVNLGSGRMINQGQIVKSAGAGTSTIDVSLTGASGHTVGVQSGTLVLAGESAFDSTLYDISPGATLRFPMDSRLTLSTDNSVTSPKVHTGTGGGTIVMETGSTLDALSGGGTTDVTSRLNFPGDMFQWEGGRLIDGTVENLGQINLTGAEQKDITGILLNSADMVQSGSGDLGLENTALTNGPNGVYDLRSDSGIVNLGSGRMINQGRMVKSAGAGTSTIEVSLTGASGHTVGVQSGTLVLAGESVFDSTLYDISPGATLRFPMGSGLTLSTDNSVTSPKVHTGTGGGQIQMLSGSTIDALSGGGRTGVTAQLNFPGDMFQWQGGRLMDGTVENLGQINLSGTDQKDITGILRNSGLIIQQNSGDLSISNLGLINAVGGTYEIRSDAGISNAGSGRLTNSGTLRKMMSSGTSLIATELENAGGLVVAESGMLDLQGEVIFSAGIFQVLNNATINFDEALDVPEDGRLAGQGTLVATTFEIDGAIEPGEGIGALSMVGDVNLNPESNLFLEIGGLSNNDQLNVSGLIATGGVVTVNFVNGFAPANGDQFTLITSTANTSSIAVDSFVINGLAPGASFDVINSGGSVILEALADAAPGEDLTTVPPPVSLMAGDGFGSAVDVDGNLLVVGLPGMNDGAGAVAVYDVVGGQAVLNVLLPVPPGFSATGFGAALAVSGDTIVVGTDGAAPPSQKIASAIAAAIYQRTQAGGYEFKQPLTAPQTRTGDGFGSSVAISGDNVVVGAPDDDEDETTPSGAAYLFNRNVASGGFMPSNKLKPETPNLAARFGQAVAISGGTLAVGAPMDKPGPTNTTGSASIYDIVAGAVTRIATTSGSGTNDGAQFGASLDIDSDGTVLVGAPMEGNGSTRSGAVYILGRQGEIFRETDRLTPMEPQDGAEFGRSVAIDQTGIFVGAPKSAAELIAAGIVHRFDRMSKTETGTLRGKSGQLGFGTSVSVSGDKVAIGAPNTARFAGAASLLLDGDRIFRGGFE